jgi:Arc/MetJ family transcription regulator
MAPVGYLNVAKQISKPDKTSMVIDRKKLAEAQKILGTRTIAETVDSAFDEVIRLAARRRLLDRIRNSKTGGIGPTPDELRRLREP